MSLRMFHLVFIVIVVVGADLFGGWAVHEYWTGGSVPTLLLGIACMIGGLGLALYGIWFVRKTERIGLR